MPTAIPEADYTRDRELVLRCQGGDPSAFSELYALHFDRLRRFCLRQVGDAHVAEEIAQDTFVRAFLALDRFGGERHFYAWLTVIARRLVIDRFRSTRRTEAIGDLRVDQGRPVEDLALARLDGEHLRAALRRVRPRHRAVLQLREWEGLSYEAIAQRLGVTESTVPPLLHRARLALRREYLALTQADLPAVVAPVVLAVTEPLRRLRDRIVQTISGIPDLGSFAHPVAALLIGSGVFAASVLGHFLPPTNGPAEEAALLNAKPGGLAGVAQSIPSETTSLSPNATELAQRNWRGRKMLWGIVGTGADEESREMGKERMREMPIHFEYGDNFAFGADPDAMRDDLEKTTRGDLRWADGEDNDRSSQCNSQGACAPDPDDMYLVREY